VWHVRHQEPIRSLHLRPVILVRSSTSETDLIVLPVRTESRPSKPMGANIYEESLKECHDCPSLRHGPEHGGGVICE